MSDSIDKYIEKEYGFDINEALQDQIDSRHYSRRNCIVFDRVSFDIEDGIAEFNTHNCMHDVGYIENSPKLTRMDRAKIWILSKKIQVIELVLAGINKLQAFLNHSQLNAILKSKIK